jgi:Immunity protein 50
MEDEPRGTLEETISILKEIPGGSEVIEWFGGWPEFGDAEVLELRLVRRGPSSLRLAAEVSAAGKHRGPPFKHAVFDFTLRDMIDVYLDGFSHQNVIGGLTLRRTKDQTVHRSLYGIGLVRGEVEIELEPCAGALGIIRCTIDNISIVPVENYQEADRG